MYPIKITAKSKEFDKGSAQWTLSLTIDSCATIMCDTIHRPDATNITVIAELAAIWTALLKEGVTSGFWFTAVMRPLQY